MVSLTFTISSIHLCRFPELSIVIRLLDASSPARPLFSYLSPLIGVTVQCCSSSSGTSLVERLSGISCGGGIIDRVCGRLLSGWTLACCRSDLAEGEAICSGRKVLSTPERNRRLVTEFAGDRDDGRILLGASDPLLTRLRGL
jgi:hypothetical protein